MVPARELNNAGPAPGFPASSWSIRSRQERKKGFAMSAEEKAKAKTEQAAGKAEKAIGRAVGNERMKAEGSSKESKGDLRGAKEKAKDAFKG